jgi:hypothetical protein
MTIASTEERPTRRAAASHVPLAASDAAAAVDSPSLSFVERTRGSFAKAAFAEARSP